MFKIGEKVVTVKNGGKVMRVVETGLPNNNGVQWVKVKSDTRSRWTLADGLRKYDEPSSVFIPDGVIVSVNGKSMPEFFQLPESLATAKELEDFIDVVLRMWLSKKETLGRPLQYRTK
jgi:hypothetical protein